jgi:hypothetical protein
VKPKTGVLITDNDLDDVINFKMFGDELRVAYIRLSRIMRDAIVTDEQRDPMLHWCLREWNPGEACECFAADKHYIPVNSLPQAGGSYNFLPGFWIDSIAFGKVSRFLTTAWKLSYYALQAVRDGEPPIIEEQTEMYEIQPANPAISGCPWKVDGILIKPSPFVKAPTCYSVSRHGHLPSMRYWRT